MRRTIYGSTCSQKNRGKQVVSEPKESNEKNQVLCHYEKIAVTSLSMHYFTYEGIKKREKSAKWSTIARKLDRDGKKLYLGTNTY